MTTPRQPGLQRFVLALVALVALGWIASAASVVVWSHRDTRRPADAIVVLGAAQYVGRPSPVLKARLDHGIALYKEGLAPRLIVTGGRGTGDTTSEAAVSKKYARRLGVPDTSITLEDRGRTTSASMRAVALMLRGRHPADSVRPRVVLVSDPFHMFRLTILARRLGLDPYTSPTPTSPISANRAEAWKYVLSESVKAPLAYLIEKREE